MIKNIIYSVVGLTLLSGCGDMSRPMDHSIDEPEVKNDTEKDDVNSNVDYYFNGDLVDRIAGDKNQLNPYDFRNENGNAPTFPDYNNGWKERVIACFLDADGDGYGIKEIQIRDVECPPGYAGFNGLFDCDDDNELIYPDAQELCDYWDNDCDGLIDEDCLCRMEEGKLCGSSDVGECRYGIQVCDLYGDWGECDCNVEPAEEVCDGLDNDCDGRVDEGVQATYYEDEDGDSFGNAQVEVNHCFLPEGYVENMLDCDDGNADIYPDAPELCDYWDNDCDGETDEDCVCIKGETQQCGRIDIGECEYGTQTCDINGGWGECIGRIVPRSDFCDGLDNDCDGETDERYNAGEVCYTGRGECRREGIFHCTENTIDTICDAIAGEPGEEFCGDDLDNDCDGRTDEDCCRQGMIRDVVRCPYFPHSFSFVIDNSGSMLSNDPTNIRYRGSHDFVNSMRNTDEASVMVFARRHEVVCGFTSDKEDLRDCFIEAENYDVDSGATNIGPALSDAIDDISLRIARKVIILLTDGDSDYNENSMRIRAEQNGISVYTLGLGAADEQSLMATATPDGGYFGIDEVEEIPALYNRIFRERRNQSWESCNERGMWVERRGNCR